MPKRIFMTGASGCIGHYIAESLIQETEHELFLLVRNPDKLKFDYQARPGVKLLIGDMQQIEQFAPLLKTMDQAILAATSWGGAGEVFEVNVRQTIALINYLDPKVCEQAIYFSTASILDRNNQPLVEAAQVGTEYIQSKYECYRRLGECAIAPKITTVFPTLVFGGNDRFPKSHITSGCSEVVRWINLIRFFRADGSFHFIHGKDIAQVILYLIHHCPQVGEERNFVLGNDRLTVDRAVEEVCTYLRKRIYVRIPLSAWLTNFFIKAFRIQMGSWDRFSLHYRHFTHRTVINPASFGLVPYCAKLADLLCVIGIPPG
ncbi:MAG: NAD(P)-dependent oxidoreductase [Synechococcales bacterium]|nr:NAD(P)-dependent oxidoreductase [Synechococcales bacterium]